VVTKAIMFEASYTISRASERRAAFVWLWHSVGVFLFGAFVVACACLFGAIVADSDREVLAFVSGMGFCYLAIYLMSALSRKGRAVTGPVTVRLTDAGIEMSSRHGESLIRWTGVTRVTLTTEFVFVRRRDSLEVVLLRAPLGPEGVALLQQRAGAVYPDSPPA
jgi:hypothetical protein